MTERGMRNMTETDDEVVRFEEDTQDIQAPSLCLIGKVLTQKTFNAFGFLETMKKAMKPSKGFTAREVGPNLFSFQFQSRNDVEDVIKKEPWHFEKNLVILKELDKGEQPSLVKFDSVGLWIRLYDLPMAFRTEQRVRTIAHSCGFPIEIDKLSIEGLGRSVRVKVRVNVSRPLKKGVKIE